MIPRKNSLPIGTPDKPDLHRYLAEFDFSYNHRVGLGCSDIDRTKAAIKGIEDKRLTYHQAH